MRAQRPWLLLGAAAGVFAAELAEPRRGLQVFTGKQEWKPPSHKELADLETALQPYEEAYDPKLSLLLWPVANYDNG
jgi:hypothetical protein